MAAKDGWQWRDTVRAVAGVTTAPSRTLAMLAGDSRKHMIPVAIIFAASCVVKALLSGWIVGIGMSVSWSPTSFAAFMVAMFNSAAAYLIVYAVIMQVGNRWAERRVRFGTVFVVMTYAMIPPMIFGSLLDLGRLGYGLSMLDFYQYAAIQPLGLVALVWGILLAIRGIKAIYGYGTARSFGILLLAGLAGMLFRSVSGWRTGLWGRVVSGWIHSNCRCFDLLGRVAMGPGGVSAAPVPDYQT